MREIWQEHWQEVKDMFDLKFREKVVRTFKRFKEDIAYLKENITAWLNYLDSNQRFLKQRIEMLEKEVAELKQVLLLKL